jgi:hypothetical protein
MASGDQASDSKMGEMGAGGQLGWVGNSVGNVNSHRKNQLNFRSLRWSAI